MNEELLRKYARLAVRSGVNVQPGQLLIINAPVKDHQFVEYCVEEAYKAGADEVDVKWSDENITHMSYQYRTVESLSNVPDWSVERVKYEHERKCCYLSISSSTPGLNSDLDQNKMRTAMIASMKKMEPYRSYTSNNEGQWSIVALPNPGWAKRVFPDKSEEDALKALWDAILYTVRVSDDNDPVEAWKKHDEDMLAHCRKLTSYQFESLHFTSGLGTDLNVELVKNHVWVGGGCKTPEGVFFNPNMPTEECFCMPHRDKVNGQVYASKPLSYSGKLIEDFWFEFRDGVVTDYGAAKQQEALKSLLDTDEGSRHLGEVALVPYDSPISLMDTLFYNTLFDENAACHLALGRCYPENLEGGTAMSKEELLAHGANSSMNHVDFMFGTADMKVVGRLADGSKVTVFENGSFVI